MPDRSISPVLQPVTLRDMHLKNRVVMASLARSRSSDDGIPPRFAADYYAQRAECGPIASEATDISNQGGSYANGGRVFSSSGPLRRSVW